MKSPEELWRPVVLGLGSWEIAFVGLALLVLFGPEHAPGALRKAGQMQARLQGALQQLEDAVDEEQRQAEKALQPPDGDDEPADASPARQGNRERSGGAVDSGERREGTKRAEPAGKDQRPDESA